MKILYIIDTLLPGGKERQLVELLKGLNNANDLVIKLVILSEDIHYTYVYDLNVDIHIIKRRYKKDLSIFNKLYRVCADFKPDIIHSWDSMCSVYALPIAKLEGAIFVNGIIRNSPLDFVFYKSKWWPLIKLTFLLSDVNLSNSYAGIEAFRAPSKNSCVIYNGFDFGRLEGLRDKAEIRREFNIMTDNVVGMVARFNHNKDYSTYIKSAIDILNKRKDVTFLAIGVGDTLKRCADLVPEDLRGYIRFLGRQKDVESIINLMDIGILSSSEDGISNSIMEYMALGKAVVATRLGGNQELVQDNVTGFLVKPNDVGDLKTKIEYLLNNKPIANDMGRHGRDRLKKEFNLEKMTDAHINLYRQCINKTLDR